MRRLNALLLLGLIPVRSSRTIDVLSALMPKPTDLVGKVKGYAAIVVETTGMKDGKKTMIKMSLPLARKDAITIIGKDFALFAKSNQTFSLILFCSASALKLYLIGTKVPLAFHSIRSTDPHIRRILRCTYRHPSQLSRERLTPCNGME